MKEDRGVHEGRYGAVGGIPVPLPVPTIVRDGYLIAALTTAFLVFPLAALVGYVGESLLVWLNNALNIGLRVSWVVPVIVGGLTAGLPPIFLAFSRTSSFILECVKWYLDHGALEKAESLARTLDYQVWYREWKRNPWFRRFVVESGLVEASARYAKFNRRLPGE